MKEVVQGKSIGDLYCDRIKNIPGRENVKNVIKSTFKTHFKSTLHISDIKKDGEQIKICFGPDNYCILTKEKILQLNQLINGVTTV